MFASSISTIAILIITILAVILLSSLSPSSHLISATAVFDFPQTRSLTQSTPTLVILDKETCESINVYNIIRIDFTNVDSISDPSKLRHFIIDGCTNLTSIEFYQKRPNDGTIAPVLPRNSVLEIRNCEFSGNIRFDFDDDNSIPDLTSFTDNSHYYIHDNLFSPAESVSISFSKLYMPQQQNLVRKNVSIAIENNRFIADESRLHYTTSIGISGTSLRSEKDSGSSIVIKNNSFDFTAPTRFDSPLSDVHLRCIYFALGKTLDNGLHGFDLLDFSDNFLNASFVVSNERTVLELQEQLLVEVRLPTVQQVGDIIIHNNEMYAKHGVHVYAATLVAYSGRREGYRNANDQDPIFWDGIRSISTSHNKLLVSHSCSACGAARAGNDRNEISRSYANWDLSYVRNIESIKMDYNNITLSGTSFEDVYAATFYVTTATYNITFFSASFNFAKAQFFAAIRAVELTAGHALFQVYTCIIEHNYLDARRLELTPQNQYLGIEVQKFSNFLGFIRDAIVAKVYVTDTYVSSNQCTDLDEARKRIQSCFYGLPGSTNEFGQSLRPVPYPAEVDSNDTINFISVSNNTIMSHLELSEGVIVIVWNLTSIVNKIVAINNNITTTIQALPDEIAEFNYQNTELGERNLLARPLYLSIILLPNETAANIAIENNNVQISYEEQPFPSSSFKQATDLVLGIALLIETPHLLKRFTASNNTITIDEYFGSSLLSASSAGIFLHVPNTAPSTTQRELFSSAQCVVSITGNTILLNNWKGTSPAGGAGIVVSQLSRGASLRSVEIARNIIEFHNVKNTHPLNVAAIRFENINYVDLEVLGLPAGGGLPDPTKVKAWFGEISTFLIDGDVSIHNNVASIRNATASSCEFLKFWAGDATTISGNLNVFNNQFSFGNIAPTFPPTAPLQPFFYVGFMSATQSVFVGSASAKILKAIDERLLSLPGLVIPAAARSEHLIVRNNISIEGNVMNQIGNSGKKADGFFVLTTGIRITNENNGVLKVAGRFEFEASFFKFANRGVSVTSGGPDTETPPPNPNPFDVARFGVYQNHIDTEFVILGASTTSPSASSTAAVFELDLGQLTTTRQLSFEIVNNSRVFVVKKISNNHNLPSLLGFKKETTTTRIPEDFKQLNIIIENSNLTISSSPDSQNMGTPFTNAIFNNLPTSKPVSSVRISNSTNITMISPTRSSIVSFSEDDAKLGKEATVEVTDASFFVPMNIVDARRLYVSNFAQNNNNNNNNELKIVTRCAEWNGLTISRFAEFSGPVPVSTFLFERCDGKYTETETMSRSTSIVPYCAPGVKLIPFFADTLMTSGTDADNSGQRRQHQQLNTVSRFMHYRAMTVTINIVFAQDQDGNKLNLHHSTGDDFQKLPGQEQSESFTKFRENVEFAWPNNNNEMMKAPTSEEKELATNPREFGMPTLSASSTVFSATPTIAVVRRAYAISESALKVELVFPSPAFAEDANPSQAPFQPLDDLQDHTIELIVKGEAFACIAPRVTQSDIDDANLNYDERRQKPTILNQTTVPMQYRVQIPLVGRSRVPNFPPGLRQAIAVGSDVSMVATMAMSSGSMIAKAKARSVLLSRYSDCLFDPEEPLGFELSPLNLQVGSDVGRYLRGAVIGNGVVFVIFTGIIFVLALIWIWYRVHKQEKRIREEKEIAKEKMRLRTGSSIILPGIKSASEKKNKNKKSPSLLKRFWRISLSMGLMPVLLNLQTILMQGSVSASISLYLYGPYLPSGLRAFDRGMAVICVGASFIFGVWMLYAVLYQLPRFPTIQFVTREEEAERRKRLHAKRGNSLSAFGAHDDSESPEEDEIIQYILHVKSEDCKECADERPRNRRKSWLEERKRARKSRMRRRSLAMAQSGTSVQEFLTADTIADENRRSLSSGARRRKSSFGFSSLLEAEDYRTVVKRTSVAGRLRNFLSDFFAHDGQWKTAKLSETDLNHQRKLIASSSSLGNKKQSATSKNSEGSSSSSNNSPLKRRLQNNDTNHKHQLQQDRESPKLKQDVASNAALRRNAKSFLEHFADLFGGLSASLPEWHSFEYALFFVMACIEGYHPEPGSAECARVGTIIAMMNVIPLFFAIAYYPLKRHWKSNFYSLLTGVIIMIQSLIILIGFYNPQIDLGSIQLAIEFCDIIFNFVDMGQLSLDLTSLYVESPAALVLLYVRVKHTLYHTDWRRKMLKCWNGDEVQDEKEEDYVLEQTNQAIHGFHQRSDDNSDEEELLEIGRHFINSSSNRVSSSYAGRYPRGRSTAPRCWREVNL